MSTDARPDRPGPDPRNPESPVPARPAVSVLLLRDAEHLEVFVQHRASTMDFAAGAVVYPGGRVDPVDLGSASRLALPEAVRTRHRQAWSGTQMGHDPEAEAILLACAVREVEEETGVRLDPTRLVPWANWVTPPDQPKRFDTYFFVADASDLPELRNTTTEAVAGGWESATQVLEEEAAGTVFLLRPTLTLLREMTELGTVARVLGAGPEVIEPVRPAH